jgi:translocation and assembly module TamB
LEVEAVTAKTIRLLRLPADTGGKAERPELPQLPKPPGYLPPVTIGRLAIERLKVEPAVFGERMDFALGGYLQNDNSDGDWAGELKLDRIDEQTLTFQASARLDRGADQLTLRLDGRDDGITSKLLGRGRAAPLRVTLEGAGPIRDWEGNLHLALPGLGAFEGKLMTAVGDRTTASLHGRLSLDQPLDPATKRVQRALFALLDEPLQLQATLRLGEDGSFSVDPFELSNAEFELIGQSRLMARVGCWQRRPMPSFRRSALSSQLSIARLKAAAGSAWS